MKTASPPVAQAATESALEALMAARVWLFDFDNTLVALEAEVDWAASRVELERYLRRAGIDEAIFREIPKGNLPLYQAVRSRLLESAAGKAAGLAPVLPSRISPTTLLAAASQLIEAYELRGAARAHPLPGTITLLQTVKANRRMTAIVTSNSSRTVTNWLAAHGLQGVVDFIVGRDTLLALKPAPEMIARALELTAAAAREAVFLGDSAADAGAARAAHVAFYGIASTPDYRERLLRDGARAVFASPVEVAEHLAGAIQ